MPDAVQHERLRIYVRLCGLSAIPG